MVKLAGTYEIPAGTEDEHNRYVQADKEYTKAWRDLDKYKEGTEKWWRHLNEVIPKATQNMFRSWDAFWYKVAHKDDPVLVSLDEVRNVVVVSMQDKTDELEFTLNSGLLGSKLAQAIRELVHENEVGEPPLCPECRN